MLRNLTIFYMEDLGVVVGFEYLCEVLSICVRNKNLPELIALYHLHNPFHPLAIQPVKDII